MDSPSRQLEGQVLLSETALCLSSHPSNPCIAAGFSTGAIAIANVTDSRTNHKAQDLPAACQASCRVVSWLDANSVVAGYSDSSLHLYDVTRAKASGVVASLRTGDGGDPEAPSAMYAMSEQVVLVGDEGGGISVCDVRAKRAVASVLEQGDYVSCMRSVEMYGTKAVLATSGDGTLCAYDLRVLPRARMKLMYAFDSFHDDVTSFCVLATAGLVVGGTLAGALHLYDARFMDRECEVESVEHVERFVGHPEAVTGVAAVDEDALVCTASTDGYVRIVDVGRRSLEDVLEYAHEKGEGEGNGLWPIENMAVVNGLKGNVFALQSHDKSMKLCEYMADKESSGEQQEQEEKEERQEKEEREQREERKGKKEASKVGKKRKLDVDRDRDKEEAKARSKAFFDGL